MFDRFKEEKVETGLYSTMAPMADIVFLLLIFFMLTSAFVLEPGIDIHLPKAVTALDQIKQRHVLTITAGGALLLDQDPVSFATLKNIIEDTYRGSETRLLIIRADDRVSHGLVVKALDIARQSGVSRLAIATEKIQ